MLDGLSIIEQLGRSRLLCPLTPLRSFTAGKGHDAEGTAYGTPLRDWVRCSSRDRLHAHVAQRRSSRTFGRPRVKNARTPKTCLIVHLGRMRLLLLFVFAAFDATTVLIADVLEAQRDTNFMPAHFMIESTSR